VPCLHLESPFLHILPLVSEMIGTTGLGQGPWHADVIDGANVNELAKWPAGGLAWMEANIGHK